MENFPKMYSKKCFEKNLFCYFVYIVRDILSSYFTFDYFVTLKIKF